MWATMEKLRMRDRLIVVSLARRVTRSGGRRRSARQPAALGDDGSRLQDDTGAHLGVGAEAHVVAQHAAGGHGLLAEAHALPEDGLRDARAGPDPAAPAQHGVRADHGPRRHLRGARRAPASRTTRPPTWAWARRLASSPSTRRAATACSPRLTRSQRMDSVTRARGPIRQPRPSTACEPTTAPAATCVPSPITA